MIEMIQLRRNSLGKSFYNRQWSCLLIQELINQKQKKYYYKRVNEVKREKPKFLESTLIRFFPIKLQIY